MEVSVVGAQGEPVDSAMVLLFNEKGEQVNEGLPPLTSNGRYRFSYLVPGPHTVRVVLATKPPVTRSFMAKVGETAQVHLALP